MAAKTINDLDALLGTAVAASDLAVLWDASGAVSVKTLADTLLQALARVCSATLVLPQNLTVQQPGGTPGTDEIQLSHSGTLGLIDCKDGSLTLKISGVGDLTLDPGGSGGIIATGSITIKNGINGWDGKQIGFAYPGDVFNTSGLKSPAAKVITITDGSTGGGTLASIPLSPAQITGNQNDYTPGYARYYRLSSDASRNITGFAAGQSGQECVFINVGSFDIVLKHQDAASAAANRFLNKSGADATIPADGMVGMIYDATTQRWRVNA